MSWIIIAGLVIIAFILLEAKDIKHRIVLFSSIGVILFLIGSLAFVFLTSDVSFTSTESIFNAGKVYVIWLGNFFENIGEISGYVIKQNWIVNSTGAG